MSDTFTPLASTPLSPSVLSALQHVLEPHHAYKSHIYSTLYGESLFVNSQTTELAYNYTIEQEREKMIRQQRQLLTYDFRPGCEKQQQQQQQQGEGKSGQTQQQPQSHESPLDEVDERMHHIDRSNCLNNICMGAETAQSLHLLFAATVQNLGSQRHADFFPSSPLIQSLYYYGCFLLTELSHGTNTKLMRTTATYDHASKSFIIHSPDKEAAKFWVGNLGKHATHGILAAQLIVKGVPRGLHWFVIQLRSLDKHQPLPGIIIGDVGRKMGWNDIDHGFVMFQYVSIPAWSLLNKYQDVDFEGSGEYQLAAGVAGENARFAKTLSALSGGRVGIGFNAVMHSRLALIIATRYSESRCQFSNPPSKEDKRKAREQAAAAAATAAASAAQTAGGDASPAAAPMIRENPVLSYQLQQYRLLLPLSYNVTFGLFARWLWATYFRLLKDQNSPPSAGSAGAAESDLLAARQNELHAISSGSKPVLTWLARDAITASRECMGGHGFSSFSRMGQIKMQVEPSVTYEGENHVLIQQTAKFVADAYRKLQQQGAGGSSSGDDTSSKTKSKKSKKATPSPLGSLAFMERTDLAVDSVLDPALFDGADQATTTPDEHLPATLLRTLQWRVVFLLQESGAVIMDKLGGGMEGFQAWNESQVFYFQEVAKAFVHVTMLSVALQQLQPSSSHRVHPDPYTPPSSDASATSSETQGTSSSKDDAAARRVLLHVWCTSALGLIVAHMESYLEGGHITAQQSRGLKALLLRLLRDFRPHALNIVNVIAPPDWVVWAPLGLKANHATVPDKHSAAAAAAAAAAPVGSDGVPLALSHASDQTYDNYFHAIAHFQTTYERAPYWQLLRQPVPIVGQEGGRFGSTQPRLIRFDNGEGGAGAGAMTVNTNSTGKAKL